MPERTNRIQWVAVLLTSGIPLIPQGATIVNSIVIADDAMIGAGTLVPGDIRARAVAYWGPARIPRAM